MPSDQPFTRAILSHITIRLSADAYRRDAEARQDLVLSVLAAALLALGDSISPAWRVRPAPLGVRLAYELLPLPGSRVLIVQAWEMVDALRAQPQIVAAEPSFVLAPDSLADLPEPDPDPPDTPAGPNGCGRS